MARNLASFLLIFFTASYNHAAESNYCYTDDFDNVVETVLIPFPSKDDPDGSITLVCNELSSVIANEGCNVVRSKVFNYVRDAKTKSPTGHVLRTSDYVAVDENGKIIKSRALKFEQHRETKHAMVASKHPFFHMKQMGTCLADGNCALYTRTADGLNENARGLGFYDSAQSRATSSSPLAIKQSRSCIEGGNVFIATNRNGVVKVLIGEDSLTMTHLLLRRIGFFKSPPGFYAKMAEDSREMPNDNIKQMFWSDAIPSVIEGISEKYRQELTDLEVKQLLYEMNAMELIVNMNVRDLEGAREIVSVFQAQREFITTLLWPAEFGVTADNIVVLPQMAYHLDVFLKPAPGGVFLASHKASNFTLANILTSDLVFSLSAGDRALINEYIDEGARLLKEMKPIYDRVYALLDAADFDIIETPAAFYSSRERDITEQISVNFINGFSAFSQQNQRPFYVTLGAKIGDRLGDLIMDEFSSFMQKQVPGIEVHFVGRKQESDGADYSAAMSFFNRPGCSAGAHCLTFELTQSRQ